MFREKDITKERVKKILDSGCNVVLSSQGIDDMSMKYFVEAGVIAARRVPKKDLKNISKITNGISTILTTIILRYND